MQKILIMGNLGKDPEEKLTANQAKLLSFSVAVTTRKGMEPTWYECIIWDNKKQMFGRVLDYLTKGTKVLIMGELYPIKAYMIKGETRLNLTVEPHFIQLAGSRSDPDRKMEKQGSIFNDEDVPF